MLPDREDALLAEMVIEKYAKAKGLDVKEVKQKWLPLLQTEEEKDPFTEGLVSACEILGQIQEVEKGLDPQTQTVLNKLSTIAVERAISKSAGKTGGGDEKFMGMVRKIKLMDAAFTDPDAAAEKIAEKISQEIGGPLAEALQGLRTTLETIATNAPNKAEEYVENPEFAELQTTMENINTTLAHLTDKIDKGGPVKGDVQTDVETMIVQVNDATEKSRSFLEKQGYKIVNEDTPATFDDAKQIVEKQGFTLQDKRVTRVEAEKMADQAAKQEREKHEDDLELKLEEKKIDAAKEVVGQAIDSIMKPFTWFLEQYLGKTIEGEPIPMVVPPAKPAPDAKVKPNAGTGKKA